MIRRLFAVVAVAGFVVMLLPLLEVPFRETLDGISEAYVTQTPQRLGAQNVVTAVVVTYRGLDTLGEVTVLFVATAGVGFLLRRSRGEEGLRRVRPPVKMIHGVPCATASEIFATGSRTLFPILILFGAYVFLHGHLTPGGGFQGGVIITSALVLVLLCAEGHGVSHTLLRVVESFSGAGYVAVGVLGLFLAGGFLDTSFLGLGEFGTLLSAGAIPVIYGLIGLKVGTELAGVLTALRGE